jgi:hypothetical protein
LSALPTRPPNRHLKYTIWGYFFPFCRSLEPTVPGGSHVCSKVLRRCMNTNPQPHYTNFSNFSSVLYFSPTPILHKKYKTIPASLFMCTKHTPNTSSTNRSKIFYKIPDFFCPTLDTTIQKNASGVRGIKRSLAATSGRKQVENLQGDKSDCTLRPTRAQALRQHAGPPS